MKLKGRPVSLSLLDEAFESSEYDVVSTDLFDTVLLRDHTVEAQRLAMACARAAPYLGVNPTALTRLRWDCHITAYRAVVAGRPEGDASLSAICNTVAEAFGLGPDASRLLHSIEVFVDIQHLRPNRPLIAFLTRAAQAGTRVVAVSDTYYSGGDLVRMIDKVVGFNPIAGIYSSADLRLTKHAGHIFEEVARQEDVLGSRIIHVGDNYGADVQMARAAGWAAVYLPRDTRFRITKVAGKVCSLPATLRRAR